MLSSLLRPRSSTPTSPGLVGVKIEGSTGKPAYKNPARQALFDAVLEELGGIKRASLPIDPNIGLGIPDAIDANGLPSAFASDRIASHEQAMLPGPRAKEAAFDPSTITPANEQERKMLDLLKYELPAQRFFSSETDLRMALWDAYKFFSDASPEEIRQLMATETLPE